MDGKRDAHGNLVIRRKVGKKVGKKKGKKVGTVGKEVSQYHDIEEVVQESASGVLTRGLQYAKVLRLRRVGKND